MLFSQLDNGEFRLISPTLLRAFLTVLSGRAGFGGTVEGLVCAAQYPNVSIDLRQL